jgi:hypothetical protein
MSQVCQLFRLYGIKTLFPKNCGEIKEGDLEARNKTLKKVDEK